MRRSTKIRGAVAASAALALLGTGIGTADTIHLGPDVTKASGASGTFIASLVIATPDGIAGCNVSASAPATISFTSSKPSVVPAPSSVQVTSCDDPLTPGIEGGVSVPYTVASGQANGAFTVIAATASGGITTTSATGKVTVGTFTADSLRITVQNPPPNTAPSVGVTGVTHGATYEFGAVPAPGCSVSDAEDTGESATPQVSGVTGPLSAYGLGSQTVTCSYTDGGGLSSSASATYSIVDTGDPVITDLGPTAGPDGDNGWYVSAVSNEFRASDSGAGFVSPLANPHTFTLSTGTSEGSAVKVGSGTVTDVAGNVSNAVDSAAFMIDLSNPTDVAFVDGPAAGSSHYFGSVPAAPTCTADDAVSGLASCVVSGYSTAVGIHTMTATATDNAGRTSAITRSYSVLAWDLRGFYQPVDMSGVWNTVKGGSTVPLKFEVFAGSELTSTAAIKSFGVKALTCPGASAPADEIELVTTGGTSLRYDATGGQFVQNWQTPKKPGTCYAVTMTTQDGSSLTANFSLK
jgi:hypothetical protein